jgi:hypothetical protein
MTFSFVAFGAVQGDTHLSAKTRDTKEAEAVAEAGLAAYMGQLNGNPTYWTSCDQPAGVTQPGAAPEWQTVGTGRYTIELLPAQATCDPASPDASMINPDGTLRVRVTGAATVGTPPVIRSKRSIVVTLRRDGFMDFLLWTNYEDQDPRVTAGVWGCDPGYVYRTVPVNGSYYGQSACNMQTGADALLTPPALGTWMDGNCNKFWRDGRTTTYPGYVRYWDTSLTPDNYSVGTFTNYFKRYLPSFTGLGCEEVSFLNGDTISGPFHTNDSIRLCGSQTFGRDANDRIEVVAGDAQQPWRPDPTGGCGAGAQPSPGTWLTGDHGAAWMDPPPSNTSLKDVATYRFTGGTKIQLGVPSSTKMTITNAGSSTVYDQPADGVIWVGNTGGACSYNPMFPFVTTGASGQTCGDAAVEGTFNRNITIAAENDIVVTDDILQESGSSAMLGLIGGQFVRIDHPSTLASSGGLSPLLPWPHCTNTPPQDTNDLEIDAAILALKGSFLLDRFGCGDSKGTLTVKGAIAQNHRGLVGTSTGVGFTKDYQYDDRLKYRTPPNFLDPTNSSWHIVRQVEQAPAAY